MLLMIDSNDEVVGEIEVYPIVQYLTGYEYVPASTAFIWTHVAGESCPRR